MGYLVQSTEYGADGVWSSKGKTAVGYCSGAGSGTRHFGSHLDRGLMMSQKSHCDTRRASAILVRWELGEDKSPSAQQTTDGKSVQRVGSLDLLRQGLPTDTLSSRPC